MRHSVAGVFPEAGVPSASAAVTKLRANFLSHRVWNSYKAIVDACCDAWNKLMSTPERLASITHRTWAKAVSG